MRERATLTLSTLIVDDEQLASDELAYLLKDFTDVEVTATGRNGLEAIDLIQKLEPDLVFLDVQMPGLDGLGAIRQMREKGIPLPYFILVTAYDQYAVEAFRLEPKSRTRWWVCGAMPPGMYPICGRRRLSCTKDSRRRVRTAGPAWNSTWEP